MYGNSVPWLQDARACYEEISSVCYEHRKAFMGKRVLCPCGDGLSSEFLQYFLGSFSWLGLKALSCVDYNPVGQGRLRSWTAGRAGPEAAFDADIPSSGDFLDPFCQDLWDNHDLIVTMPPDELFDECLLSAMKRGRGFLLLGHISHGSEGPGAEMLRQGLVQIEYGLGGRMSLVLSGDGPLPEKGWWRDDAGIYRLSSRDVIWFSCLT